MGIIAVEGTNCWRWKLWSFAAVMETWRSAMDAAPHSVDGDGGDGRAVRRTSSTHPVIRLVDGEDEGAVRRVLALLASLTGFPDALSACVYGGYGRPLRA